MLVTVLDKGRGVGGRLATRRLTVDGQTATFDHGAQFFTARSPQFQESVARWQSAGIAGEWFRGQTKAKLNGITAAEAEGHPRFYAADGMTAIAKDIAASLDIRLNHKVTHISRDGMQWSVRTDDGTRFVADALLLTPPVPQSLALLAADDFQLPDAMRAALETMQYESCIAAMIVLDEPGKIPAPGALVFDEEPIYWLADNYQKGVSTVPGSVTIHAAPQWSRDHYTLDDDITIKVLCDAVAPFLGAEVKASSIARWRYSKPIAPREDGCLALFEERLVFAGDAFGGAKIEGAFRSGLAAAQALLG